MRLLVLILAVLLAVPPQALARSAASLGALTVAASRVPDFYAVPGPDTSGWPQIDVTNQTAVDTVYSGNGDCDAIVTGLIGITARHDSLECMIDNNPETNLILFFPAASYDFGDETFAWFTTNNLEIKGAGASSTILLFQERGTFYSGSVRSECRYSGVYLAGDRPTVSQTWVSGFTRGEDTIGVTDASTFSVDDWVLLHHDGLAKTGVTDACPGGHCDQKELEQVVQITATDNDLDTITIDRPLRIDYSFWGESPLVYEFNPRESVGISDLTIEYDNVGGLGTDTGIVCFSWVVNSWVKNVRFDNFYNKVITLKQGAERNYVAQNQMWDAICTAEGCGNDGYLILLNYAHDNLVHDNICGNAAEADRGNKRGICVILYYGSNGNMVTYNYADDCGAGLTNGKDRFIFFHGNFPFENLVEGNVSGEDCRMSTDTFYKWQGPRNTFFRNRFMDHDQDATKPPGMRIQRDDGDRFSAYESNYFLNFAGAWYTASLGCGDDEGANGTCHPFDFTRLVTEESNIKLKDDSIDGGVFEYNIGTNTNSVDDCTFDGVPYACCTGNKTARQDGCTFGFALHPDGHAAIDNNNLDRNSDTAAINGPWSGDSLPHSLVNLDEDGTSGGWNGANLRPPGWCNEISAWPAVGADVDVMPTSNTVQIPAQRRYDGEACTPWTGESGGTGVFGGSVAGGGGLN